MQGQEHDCLLLDMGPMKGREQEAVLQISHPYPGGFSMSQPLAAYLEQATGACARGGCHAAFVMIIPVCKHNCAGLMPQDGCR